MADAKPKRDHHKYRVSAFEAVTQFEERFFTEFDPPLTEEEQATFKAALASAQGHDVAPLTAFWTKRYEDAADTTLEVVRAICQYLDRREDGTEVDPHIHYVARAYDPRAALDLKEISHALGIVPTQIERPHRGEKVDNFVENKSAYLIHALESDSWKHHYDPSEVVSYRGEDFRALELRSRRKWSFASAKKAFKSLDDEIAYHVMQVLDGTLTRRDILTDQHLRMVYGSSPGAKSRFDTALEVASEARQLKAHDDIEYGRASKTVVWAYGESGTGKTSIFVKTLVHFLEGAFGWSCFEGGTRNPIDGYGGEEVVWLDDLRSKNKDGDGMAFEEVLRLFDPHKANKGAARYHDPLIACKLVIVTTSTSLLDFGLYSRGIGRDARRAGSIDQLLRRVDVVLECKSPACYYCVSDGHLVGPKKGYTVSCYSEDRSSLVGDKVVNPPAKQTLTLHYSHDSSFLQRELGQSGGPPYVSYPYALVDVTDLVMRNAGLGPLTWQGIKELMDVYAVFLRLAAKSIPIPDVDPLMVRNVARPEFRFISGDRWLLTGMDVTAVATPAEAFPAIALPAGLPEADEDFTDTDD